MERHASLRDLSRDHHFALRHVQEIERALSGHALGRPPIDVAREFLRFWEQDALLHFREEDEILVPVLARHGAPTEDPDVRRMLDDHAWFRDAIPELERRASASEPIEGLLAEVGRRLHDHVRHEERVLFPKVERTLTPEDLEAVAARSRTFREKWRTGAGTCDLPSPDE